MYKNLLDCVNPLVVQAQYSVMMKNVITIIIIMTFYTQIFIYDHFQNVYVLKGGIVNFWGLIIIQTSLAAAVTPH